MVHIPPQHNAPTYGCQLSCHWWPCSQSRGHWTDQEICLLYLLLCLSMQHKSPQVEAPHPKKTHRTKGQVNVFWCAEEIQMPTEEIPSAFQCLNQKCQIFCCSWRIQIPLNFDYNSHYGSSFSDPNFALSRNERFSFTPLKEEARPKIQSDSSPFASSALLSSFSAQEVLELATWMEVCFAQLNNPLEWK